MGDGFPQVALHLRQSSQQATGLVAATDPNFPGQVTAGDPLGNSQGIA